MNIYMLITWVRSRVPRNQAGFVSAENIAYAVVGVVIVFGLYTLFNDQLGSIAGDILARITGTVDDNPTGP